MIAVSLAAVLAAVAPITVDKDAHSVTFTAVSTDCGLDTQLEFLFVGPDSDHGYEAMFTTEAKVSELAAAFAEAGIPLGAPVNQDGCRFWPVGENLVLEPAFTNLVRDSASPTPPEIIYTGGTRDGKGIPEAETNMPSAVFALYNCPQSLFQLDDSLDQSATYGRFHPAVKLPKGEKRTFTVRWNGSNSCQSVTVRLPKDLLSLKPLAARTPLSVTPELDPAHTLADTASLALVLSGLDSRRFKVNGFVPGQFFYKAFLPREQWRDRKERLAQPPEVHLKPDGSFVVTKITEDWSDEESVDPKLVAEDRSFKNRDEAMRYASEVSGKTLTVLVFAPAKTTLADLFALRAAADPKIVNWYFFTE